MSRRQGREGRQVRQTHYFTSSAPSTTRPSLLFRASTAPSALLAARLAWVVTKRNRLGALLSPNHVSAFLSVGGLEQNKTDPASHLGIFTSSRSVPLTALSLFSNHSLTPLQDHGHEASVAFLDPLTPSYAPASWIHPGWSSGIFKLRPRTTLTTALKRTSPPTAV